MQLILSSDEASELRHLLDSALSDLRSEIFHTDTPGFKERLHERERLLLELRARLGESGAAA